MECEVQQGGEPGGLCKRRQIRQHLLNTCLKYMMQILIRFSCGCCATFTSDDSQVVFGMTQFICYVSKCTQCFNNDDEGIILRSDFDMEKTE